MPSRSSMQPSNPAAMSRSHVRGPILDPPRLRHVHQPVPEADGADLRSVRISGVPGVGIRVSLSGLGERAVHVREDRELGIGPAASPRDPPRPRMTARSRSDRSVVRPTAASGREMTPPLLVRRCPRPEDHVPRGRTRCGARRPARIVITGWTVAVRRRPTGTADGSQNEHGREAGPREARDQARRVTVALRTRALPDPSGSAPRLTLPQTQALSPVSRTQIRDTTTLV